LQDEGRRLIRKRMSAEASEREAGGRFERAVLARAIELGRPEAGGKSLGFGVLSGKTRAWERVRRQRKRG